MSMHENFPSGQEVKQLRDKHYNATLIERIDIHSDLAKFRIRPDGGVPKFQPGQYVALGLGYWETRLPGTQAEEFQPDKFWKVVRRAYSISCPLLDREDNLLPCDRCDYLEFYVTLIREADQPPALTPRLFNLDVGQRLFVQSRVVGTYTLDGISPDDDVVMLATGTGEAPHNAMAAHLLSCGHRGKIIVATCARVFSDFGYRREHDVLASTYENFKYLTYTTREPRNLNPTAEDYVGIERLQTVYGSGRLAREANLKLQSDATHVFLCGNPAMIGLRRPTDPPLTHPGMLQLLLRDGFKSLHPVPAVMNGGEHVPESEESTVVAKKSAGSDASATQKPGPGIVRYEKYW